MQILVGRDLRCARVYAARKSQEKDHGQCARINLEGGARSESNTALDRHWCHLRARATQIWSSMLSAFAAAARQSSMTQLNTTPQKPEWNVNSAGTNFISAHISVTSAIRTSYRRGPGRTRHLVVQYLGMVKAAGRRHASSGWRTVFVGRCVRAGQLNSGANSFLECVFIIFCLVNSFFGWDLPSYVWCVWLRNRGQREKVVRSRNTWHHIRKKGKDKDSWTCQTCWGHNSTYGPRVHVQWDRSMDGFVATEMKEQIFALPSSSNCITRQTAGQRTQVTLQGSMRWTWVRKM